MKTTKFSFKTNASDLNFDFVFIVGDLTYQVNKYIAYSQCSSVRNQFLCDASCSSYRIELSDPSHSFQFVIDLLQDPDLGFHELVKDYESLDINFLRLVAVDLQFNRLTEMISPVIISNLNNLISLNNLESFRNIYDYSPESYIQICQPELNYISQNFSEFSNEFERLSKLPVEALDSILMDPDLNADDNTILKFVFQATKANSGNNSYFALFAHVLYDNIETDKAKTFFQYIKGHEISGALWLSITRRLKCDVI
ncbi:hypothetical protein TRFO_16789 [Tritrichomonas foetus]|uniref:BTB domain-containing protein n=1 Tax=Tritrichomonas foetus TaxID=1144522 RepID=A0A1J4KPB3_9EUKA|nr:hypothetical protein TRFO_16789 [Tritrichomonas foetus]|eukprot:OHT13137.1 hypothetical protein TRFO_16789 [Tritrichomonas foetus]